MSYFLSNDEFFFDILYNYDVYVVRGDCWIRCCPPVQIIQWNSLEDMSHNDFLPRPWVTISFFRRNLFFVIFLKV